MSLLGVVKWLMCACVLFFISLPIIVKLYPYLTTHMVFVNMVRWPPFIDFNKPQDFGLNHTRNFQLQNGDVTLGLWHVLPNEYATLHQSEAIDYPSSLNSGHPVLIYFHGNSGTRAGWHRSQIYKKLSHYGFHVITVDYRGISPTGIILEAPFNNLHEAASRHPFTFPYHSLPGFSSFFLEPLAQNNIFFETDKNIATVRAPLLILHAQDDYIVPHDLGHKLYKEALKYRSGTDLKTKFISFDASLRYGHKHIFREPTLQTILQNFVDDCLK